MKLFAEVIAMFCWLKWVVVMMDRRFRGLVFVDISVTEM